MRTINDLRLKINEIDQEILELIVARLKLVRKIGRLKKEQGLSVVDQQREKEVLNHLIDKSDSEEIKPEMIKKIWKDLMEISYQIEGDNDGNS